VHFLFVTVSDRLVKETAGGCRIKEIHQEIARRKNIAKSVKEYGDVIDFTDCGQYIRFSVGGDSQRVFALAELWTNRGVKPHHHRPGLHYNDFRPGFKA
jgi:hypothetical protein